MESATLENKIAKLSENLKLKVEGYVDALIDAESQNRVLNELEVTYKNSRVPKPIFGNGKGIFGKMADDFDAPLDDMKEYM